MRNLRRPLIGLSLLALLQVMCATITVENTSSEQAAVQLMVDSGGTYSARVAPGGSVFWTVSKSGPYTVRVFPFEPYRDLMREKRQAIQTLLTSKTPTAAERRELLRQVRLDQMELDLDSVYVLGGGTACSGAIPEIADFVDDDFVNIFVTLSYDQAAVQWKAVCG